MPRVLILTAKTGRGHLSLAEALRDLLHASAHVDLIAPMPAFVNFHYRFASRHAPWLWAAEYALLNTPRRVLAVQILSARLVGRRLLSLFASVHYDLVVTTFPFLTYEVTEALRRLPRTLPFVMLMTDPDRLHAAWLTERRAAATFAPTRETYAQALAAGFAPDRLHLTGWPVRRQFLDVEPAGRKATLAQLHLDPDRLTLFVQGGGDGAAGFSRSVESALAAAPDTLQIILAAGTNRALIERFHGVEHVRVLPSIFAIAPFMAASDVIVGKAGPNVLFEAITLGKPFIATTYMPGQERATMEFIQSHKLGWIALEPHAQHTLIAELVSNPERLTRVAQQVLRYRRWNMEAVATIAPQIDHILSRANGSVHLEVTAH